MGYDNDQIQLINKAIRETKAEIKGYYPGSKKKRLLIEAVLYGTTFTGHPTKTTLGNSLRQLALLIHLKYTLKWDIDFFVSGDDTLIICDEELS